MSKKNNNDQTHRIEGDAEQITNERLIEVDLKKLMESSFIDYSMSVITARALPDVRDGLKPVHRRILYAMYEDGILPDRQTKKCATTVGNVLGRYHPHGDSSVYDAMVRLVQPFSMRYPLIEGQGNFGTIDGDPPAAYRYTESKMNKLSVEMLTDIEKNTVDFMPNFDDSLEEPTVLPSRFPNLLVNGTIGIAVGMASKIPPHNLGEVCDAINLVLDNPDATLEDLMTCIQGPDFPTAGLIMGKAGIRAAYATGHGSITMRAKAEIVEGKNGRFSIVVTELPYMVNKAMLIQNIAELVREKRIDGISNIEDHSSKRAGGIRITIDLKRDAQPSIVLNKLYKYTQLQTTFAANLLAVDKGEPKTLTLRMMIDRYIEHQLEVILRRTIYLLAKAKDRAHILEALVVAIDFIDEVIAILRSSKSIPEGKQRLMDRFEFDDVQATAIVQMRLGALTGLEKSKLEDELAEIKKKIEEYNILIADEGARKGKFKEELGEISRRFGDDRLTEIVPIDGEMDIEDLIAQEDCVITLTNFGYVKRQKVDTYQTQHRGGRGISAMTTREEDTPIEMFLGFTHDYVMFFSNQGRVYRLKGYDIPEGTRNAKGLNIVNLLALAPEEKITSMIRVGREYENEMYLVMVTKKGLIKRTPLSAFNNIRKKGVIALNLRDGDELVWTALTEGDSELLVATRGGMSIRIKESDVRIMGRAAAGVRAIRLRGDDEVVSLSVLREDAKVLTVSENGYGRLSEIENYRIQRRGGYGIKNYRAEVGAVAAVRVVDNDDDIIIISDAGVIIRVAVEEIRVCRRPSKGVRVMRLGDEQKIVTIARVPHDEEAEHSDVETEAPDDEDIIDEAEELEAEDDILEDDEEIEAAEAEEEE